MEATNSWHLLFEDAHKIWHPGMAQYVAFAVVQSLPNVAVQASIVFGLNSAVENLLSSSRN